MKKKTYKIKVNFIACEDEEKLKMRENKCLSILIENAIKYLTKK